MEEIDIIEKGKNYGWNIMEGTDCYQPSSGCDTTGLEMPIWEYRHNASGGNSVTGGYVYRGSRVPELVGAYVYADFGSGRIWTLRYDGAAPPENNEILDTNLFISSFGVDAENRLYICAFDGKIYRFKSTVTSNQLNKTILKSMKLKQNYPNPLRPGAEHPYTTISFELSANAYVEILVYNILGRLVTKLSHQYYPLGTYTLNWNGRDSNGQIVSEGTYFYQLKTDGQVQVVKKILILN